MRCILYMALLWNAFQIVAALSQNLSFPRRRESHNNPYAFTRDWLRRTLFPACAGMARRDNLKYTQV